MSQKVEKKAEKATTQQIPNNVVEMGPAKCTAEGCKSKPTKAGFCDQHYDWFKQGLITKSGGYAKDFDKKYQHYLKNKKVA